MSILKNKKIISSCHKELSAKNKLREKCLSLSREIIRNSSYAIKHIHRREKGRAKKILQATQKEIMYFKKVKKISPDIYFSGYILDAQKEYAEACILYSIVYKENIPSPEKLNIEKNSYLQGMGETIGELRRYILNSLKDEKVTDIEKLFEIMEEIYYLLFGFDYPDSLLGGLRKIVDAGRSIIERTHSDMVLTLSQYKLANHIKTCKNI